MTQNKKIYYWSPHLVNIATPRAVVNSAYSIQKYSTNFKPSIINFFGEFNNFKEELNQKKINLINFYNHKIINFLPKHGFLQSRFSFIVLFILAFVPLKNLIKKNKPDFLIIHLITALPLFLLLFFNFETKFILRISGMPRLNYLRKIFWKLASKKIFLVTCPTIKTLNYIKNLNIIDQKKIVLLYDPVINVKEFRKKISIINNANITINSDYIFAAGRLTFQKNFLFLCNCFKMIIAEYPNLKLLIAGEGEDRMKILSYIMNNNLEKNIILIGYVDNIYYYMRNAKFFILTSLWEDPGFVLLEAAISRTLVVASDCDSGPNELIKDKINGIQFLSNNQNSCVQQIRYALKANNKKKKLILNNLYMCKKFTLFYHYRDFAKILSHSEVLLKKNIFISES